MELFSGNRDSAGDMNWERIGKILNPQNELSITDRLYSSASNLQVYDATKMYSSLSAPVYYYNRKLTIKELVDTLQRRGVEISIDTLYTAYRLEGQYDFEPHRNLYKIYRVVTREDRIKEKERLEKQRQLETAEKEEEERNTVNNPVKKYYGTATISQLGWINCDRYFNEEKTEVLLEPVYTMLNSTIDYFFIFKSFNGLISGRTLNIGQLNYAIKGLPVGQAVTLKAFTRNNGVLLEYSRDLIIKKNARLSLDFKPVSVSEMQNMYAANIKI
jgi:hypothetical protein